MPLTYVLIASNVVTTPTGIITFSSIPQTYTDLKFVISARAATDESQLELQFNNNTSNYSMTRLNSDGSTVDSASQTSVSQMQFGRGATSVSTANTFGNSEVYIPNYTSSNNKSASGDGTNENNATLARRGFYAGLWANSAAITSIKIFFNGSPNFVQYSTATLYGIKNS